MRRQKWCSCLGTRTSSTHQVNPTQTLQQSNSRNTNNELRTRQKELNKRYQELAEDCGLGVVLLLLNFEDANAMQLVNVVDHPLVAEAALAEIYGKITKKFKANGNELSAHAPPPPEPTEMTRPTANRAAPLMVLEISM